MRKVFWAMVTSTIKGNQCDSLMKRCLPKSNQKLKQSLE